MRNKTRKSIVILLIISALALPSFGCGKSATTPESKKSGTAPKEEKRQKSDVNPKDQKALDEAVTQQELNQSAAEIDAAVSDIDQAIKEIDSVETSQDNVPQL